VTKPAPSPGIRLALDYGPLLVFFAVNFLVPAPVCRSLVAAFTPTLDALTRVEALLIARVIVATVAFTAATVLAVIWSLVRLKHVSPMLWITAVLVIVFGGLTVYFHDPRFIQMKPTFVYGILAAVLGFGLATGRPLLQQLLGTAYPGLSAAGWRKLTVNWAVFFAALGVANEIARAALSYDAWVLFKFPGCTVATVLFAVANVPMLLRHGLTLGEEETAAAGQLPPE
jgi:intracellular septation protein